MTISERTLRKWRKESLVKPFILATYDGVDEDFHNEEIKELNKRILLMTQELLDQHLVGKKTILKGVQTGRTILSKSNIEEVERR